MVETGGAGKSEVFGGGDDRQPLTRPVLHRHGAGDRIRTGDVQLGKLTSCHWVRRFWPQQYLRLGSVACDLLVCRSLRGGSEGSLSLGQDPFVVCPWSASRILAGPAGRSTTRMAGAGPAMTMLSSDTPLHPVVRQWRCAYAGPPSCQSEETGRAVRCGRGALRPRKLTAPNHVGLGGRTTCLALGAIACARAAQVGRWACRTVSSTTCIGHESA